MTGGEISFFSPPSQKIDTEQDLLFCFWVEIFSLHEDFVTLSLDMWRAILQTRVSGCSLMSLPVMTWNHYVSQCHLSSVADIFVSMLWSLNEVMLRFFSRLFLPTQYPIRHGNDTLPCCGMEMYFKYLLVDDGPRGKPGEAGEMGECSCTRSWSCSVMAFRSWVHNRPLLHRNTWPWQGP